MKLSSPREQANMDDFGHSGTQRLPDSFYLPLLSDSSGHLYADNKLSHFRVQLAEPLYLDGAWECGLAEVQLPVMPLEVRSYRRRIVRRCIRFENLFRFIRGSGKVWAVRRVVRETSEARSPRRRVEAKRSRKQSRRRSRRSVNRSEIEFKSCDRGRSGSGT